MLFDQAVNNIEKPRCLLYFIDNDPIRALVFVDEIFKFQLKKLSDFRGLRSLLIILHYYPTKMEYCL